MNTTSPEIQKPSGSGAYTDDVSWQYILGPEKVLHVRLPLEDTPDVACRYELDRLSAQGLLERTAASARPYIYRPLDAWVWATLLGEPEFPDKCFARVSARARDRLNMLFSNDREKMERNAETIVSIHYDLSRCNEGPLCMLPGIVAVTSWPHLFWSGSPGNEGKSMSLTCALPPNWSKVVEDAPIEAANCIRMVKSRPWLLTSMVCSLRNLLALKKKAITKFDVHDKALMTPDGPSYSFWPLSSAYSGEASDAVAQVLLEVDFDLSDSVIIAELKLHLRTLREKLTRRVSNTKVEASKKDSLRDPGSWTLLKCIALFRLNKCFKSRRKAIAWCEKQVDDLPDDLKKSYNWSRSIAKVVKMFCEEVAGWPNEPGAT